jgi:hypothetical protein
MNMEIAIHEAGHAVVADALGFTNIRCIPTDGGFAIEYTGPDKPTSLECFLLAAVALAGPAAQQHEGYTVEDSDARNDMNQALRFLATYAGFADVPPASSGLLAEPLERACDLAGAIIRDRSETVHDVAARIHMRRGDVDEASMLAVLRACS